MSKNMYAIIGTVAVVAVVAVAIVLLVLPGMQTSVREIELDMVDYGYDRAGFAPTLTIKAGELVRITLINVGSQDHEFMVIRDNEMSLMNMKSIISEIDDMDISEEEKLDLYETRHNMMIGQMAAFGINIHVHEDETEVSEFTINEAGQYWYVCHEAGGTWPEIHQEKGMIGTLIVE